MKLIEAYRFHEADQSHLWRFRGSPSDTRHTTIISILANMRIGEELEFFKNEFEAINSAVQSLKNRGEGRWTIRTEGDKVHVERVSDTSDVNIVPSAPGTRQTTGKHLRQLYKNPTVVSMFLKMSVGDEISFSVNNHRTVRDAASKLKRQGEGQWTVNKHGNELIVRRLSDQPSQMGKFDRTGLKDMFLDMRVGDEVEINATKLIQIRGLLSRLKMSNQGKWQNKVFGDVVKVKRMQ